MVEAKFPSRSAPAYRQFRLHRKQWEVPENLNGEPFYTTHAITDFATEFLDDMTKKDDPFLLYVAYNAPHYPLQAPKRDVEKYKGRYDAGRDALRKQRHEKQLQTGLLSQKWKLCPRPRHVPAWDSRTLDEHILMLRK